MDGKSAVETRDLCDLVNSDGPICGSGRDCDLPNFADSITVPLELESGDLNSNLFCEFNPIQSDEPD